jgi:hypothetical protein
MEASQNTQTVTVDRADALSVVSLLETMIFDSPEYEGEADYQAAQRFAESVRSQS